MLVVETVAKIRREHFGRGKGVKTIARELGLSRNTVRKVLRSGETSFEYERTEQPRPKLGAFTERLEAMLETNAFVARKGPADADADRRPVGPRGLRRRLRCGPSVRWPLDSQAPGRELAGRGVRAAELCAGRRLPV